jgi:L-asparaginase II
VQREVKAAMESLAGVTLDRFATDGCSIPTWATPLSALAFAFARFGTGVGLEPERAKAAARLRAACAAKPWFVAGTGRFCTLMMEHFGPRLLVKTGAEGTFCASLPSEGYGIAVKCDDGAGRAAEVMMAAAVARFLPLDDRDHDFLRRFVQPELRNWNEKSVGGIRPTAALLPPR